MKRFPVDPNYAKLLREQNLSVTEILSRADLPVDLFSRPNAALSSEEYLRFMTSIGEAVQGTDLPVLLATSAQIETITPPIFAAYCSQDGLHCIRRLAQYKALAGALTFAVTESPDEVTVSLQSADSTADLPELVVGVEMVLLVNLIRKAARQQIRPVRITVHHSFQNPSYEHFLECPAVTGAENCITFARSDMEIPFLTRNDSMWSFFEPELRRRLSELDVDDTLAAQVRNALAELLPSGACSIEDVCARLCISKRTLQRKLGEEGTTFQKQLNHTRALLAKNYLKSTDLSSEDIAFLLGYQDVTSFFRAFSLWTGQGVAEYKAQLRKKTQ